MKIGTYRHDLSGTLVNVTGGTTYNYEGVERKAVIVENTVVDLGVFVTKYSFVGGASQ
jgi:hypothetical protein